MALRIYCLDLVLDAQQDRFEIEQEFEEPINFLKAPSTAEHKRNRLANVLKPAYRKADDLSSMISTKKSNPCLAAAINRLKPFFELALDTLPPHLQGLIITAARDGRTNGVKGISF